MRRIVNWIKQEYGDVDIIITENGISDTTGELEDYHRITYYDLYLNELMKGRVELVFSSHTCVY